MKKESWAIFDGRVRTDRPWFFYRWYLHLAFGYRKPSNDNKGVRRRTRRRERGKTTQQKNGEIRGEILARNEGKERKRHVKILSR